MRKFFVILMTMLFAVALTSCKSCSKHEPETELNFDEIIKADYDYVASQYPQFKFFEADVEYDTTINVDGAKITSIRNVFQLAYEPMDSARVMFITHTPEGVDTLIQFGHWMECMEMSAYNAVGYDSMMTIIEPRRAELNTRYMTFRRVLAPSFPTCGQYIWGPGILVVDGATGEIVDWNDDNWTEGCLEDEPQALPIIDKEFVNAPDSFVEIKVIEQLAE